MSDTPTAEEQLEQVAAAYNMLVRKNRSLLNQLAAAGDEKADLQARAETQIEALQKALQEAQLRIETLEAANTDLAARITALEAN